MTAADAIRAFLTPLLPGWRIQFGRWTDGGGLSRYAVLKPMGGLPAELVRHPQYSLILIGAADDEATAPGEVADTIVEAMRTSSGTLVFMQPGEPVHRDTDDGRPISEIAISAITN